MDFDTEITDELLDRNVQVSDLIILIENWQDLANIKNIPFIKQNKSVMDVSESDP